MKYTAEIVSRFDSRHPSNGLLYSPVDEASTYRESRVYEFDLESDSDVPEARAFVERVLSDAVSQIMSDDGAPVVNDYCYYMDVAMKDKVLDLEKQYLLQHYRHTKPNFTLQGLTIHRRIYIFGDAEILPPARLEKDIVNPVIQKASLAWPE